jgi:hypothetical protein
VTSLLRRTTAGKAHSNDFNEFPELHALASFSRWLRFQRFSFMISAKTITICHYLDDLHRRPQVQRNESTVQLELGTEKKTLRFLLFHFIYFYQLKS